MKTSSSSQQGFTLVEVVIAVVVLASAFITLLGLQSAIMRRTLRDEARQQEMLLARSILSAIESNLEAVEVQDKTMPAEELIDEMLADAAPDVKQEKRSQLFNFMARITVDLWGIPNFKDDAMKRIRLAIYLEDDPADAFEVLFFIPNEDQQQPAT